MSQIPNVTASTTTGKKTAAISANWPARLPLL
jgi:hypothetical protein